MYNPKICKSGIVITWVCRACIVYRPSAQRAASFQILPDCCSSGPALSDGKGWTSEPWPDNHSLLLWSDSLTDWENTGFSLLACRSGWKKWGFTLNVSLMVEVLKQEASWHSSDWRNNSQRQRDSAKNKLCHLNICAVVLFFMTWIKYLLLCFSC